MNLTAVREVNDVMERHVEDSLAILPPLSDCYRSRCGSSCDKLSLVDVGTGAGLPGVVLAIARPGLFLCDVFNIWIVSLLSGVRRDMWFNGIDWDVTLMESMNKRCVFLDHVVGVIGSSNVKIVRGRAEVKYTPVLLITNSIWFFLFFCLNASFYAIFNCFPYSITFLFAEGLGKSPRTTPIY